MAKKNAVRVTPSTGNVFRDLGFSKEEAEHLLVRADLMIQVQKAITSKRLKQADAAKTLRVTQPRVSEPPHLVSNEVLFPPTSPCYVVTAQSPVRQPSNR